MQLELTVSGLVQYETWIVMPLEAESPLDPSLLQSAIIWRAVTLSGFESLLPTNVIVGPAESLVQGPTLSNPSRAARFALALSDMTSAGHVKPMKDVMSVSAVCSMKSFWSRYTLTRSRNTRRGTAGGAGFGVGQPPVCGSTAVHSTICSWDLITVSPGRKASSGKSLGMAASWMTYTDSEYRAEMLPKPMVLRWP